MKALTIIAHPNLQQSRVNKRWAEELRKHPDQVTIRELYASYPQRNIDTAHEQKLIAEHDRLVLQFPFQWYGTPSLLKQWLDEVFTTDWLFGSGGQALADKELVLAISIGGAEAAYRAGGLIGYTVSELTRPLQAFANQIGLTLLPHFQLHDAVRATEEQIDKSAQAYVEHILNPELNPRIVRQRMLEGMKAQV